jgi:AraC family transcriptional regulator
MRKREVTMPNITSQGANLSPFAKMLNTTSQGANKTMLDVFMQCLYSSEQRWEGIIAEVYQACFPREPLYLMQRANSTLALQLQGITDMQRQSDGRTEQGRFYKGSIILEPPEVFPTYFPQETPAVILTLGLAPSLFEQTVAEMGRHDPTHVEIVKQFNLHDPLIEQIGLAFVSELAAGGAAGRVYAESLVRTLVLHLLRLSSTASLVPPSSYRNFTPRQIAMLRDYMYDRLDQDISLSELAASVGFSVSYFTRLFKQSLGLAPHQYLIACRVERAKSLLLSSDLTLAEVAHAVGFVDQSHLNRHFKRMMGISPGMLCDESKEINSYGTSQSNLGREIPQGH